MVVPQIFSSNPLDRGERERRDEAWIHLASRDQGSKFLPLWNLKVPLSTGADTALVWLSFEDLGKLEIEADPILLGLMEGAAHFAARGPDDDIQTDVAGRAQVFLRSVGRL